LQVDKFTDYCPNGLQIQGKSDIKKIISGVSANQDLIDAAIDEKTDALFVHHGFFWKNEAAEIIGICQTKVSPIGSRFFIPKRCASWILLPTVG
jgi:putative NIF3 family GTP cyclohydrolase 1 type 2